MPDEDDPSEPRPIAGGVPGRGHRRLWGTHLTVESPATRSLVPEAEPATATFGRVATAGRRCLVRDPVAVMPDEVSCRFLMAVPGTLRPSLAPPPGWPSDDAGQRGDGVARQRALHRPRIRFLGSHAVAAPVGRAERMRRRTTGRTYGALMRLIPPDMAGWTARFNDEAAVIHRCARATTTIEHVGSTALGIEGKDVVDVLLGVSPAAPTSPQWRISVVPGSRSRGTGPRPRASASATSGVHQGGVRRPR